jgi:hypothetical protein
MARLHLTARETMGLLDRFRKKKNPPVEEKGAHYHSTLDYLSTREEDINCPECAAHQKHVKLKKTEGEQMECPECHYIHMARR